MTNHSIFCCNSFVSSPAIFLHSSDDLILSLQRRRNRTHHTVFASKSCQVSVNSGLHSLALGNRAIILARLSRAALHRRPRVIIGVRVHAVSSQGRGPRNRPRAPPGVDTRIHWDNEDEGWLGGSTATNNSSGPANEKSNLLGDKFADLLNESTDSHYQFLGISAEADLEEIKTAYRRLSKEYHPDTTSLPLKTASEKFLRLREVYDVLSNEETRRFYDWTLAKEAASRQAEMMKIKLEDPRIQDLENYVPVPDVVDRLGGRNMDLSDQAVTALTFDVFVVIFAICCIIYVMVFRESY